MITTTSNLYIQLLEGLGATVDICRSSEGETRYLVGIDGKNVIMSYEAVCEMALARYRMRWEKVEWEAAERRAARKAARKRR